MGLFVKDDNGRSQLQSKVASDLRQRLQDREEIDSPEVEPRFTEGTHETRTAGVVIMILGLILLGALLAWALKLGGVL